MSGFDASTLTNMTSTEEHVSKNNPLDDGTISEVKELIPIEKINACDNCSKIANTVKPYDRHIMVCSSIPWEAKIEHSYPFSNLLSHITNHKTANSIDIVIKVTACDRPNSLPDKLDILVYPEARMYSIEDSRLEEFCYALVMGIFDTFDSQPLPWNTLILACIHASRDKRCGRAGPQVIEEVNKQLLNTGNPNNIAILGCSHLGGHEFAGIVIVYPEGQWYGYITKRTVTELLENIKNKTTLEKCYRGKANLSW